VQIGTRTLSLSNPDKVLFPDTGFTKGQLVDYYARVAEVMVPHLQARPITLRRWPDGVEGESFYQKHCPKSRPEWMGSVAMGGVNYCLIEERAALVWAANLASIEIHPGLATAAALGRPTSVVFDLDPGPPADILTCARVAFLLRECFDHLGLEVWPKTSGSKGLQLYVPLNNEVTYDQTKEFALALAQLLETEHPDLVISAMERAQRGGKVMIDWSQNAPSKTTVAVYSVRARPQPSVSTPVTWVELEAAVKASDAASLHFRPEQVLERLDQIGDLQQPVLDTRQQLPALKT
jgi:bifunctional non-homologous end joining protein LigD